MKSITSSRQVVIRILCLVFLVGVSSATFSQEVSQSVIDPHDPVFREQFKDVAFGEELALFAAADNTNNYFILDMTRFSSRFEKIWFLYRIFQEEKVVNIDSDISSSRFWFLANRKYSEKEVLDIFSELKKSTDEVSGRMTEEEKSEWMKANDKYKQEKRDEQ
ncbi:MAG: hypothetical protein IH596_05385 [Bacteroidales bacterium]|nr:hypothetical protein [Bacteroidales bacterium]